ncbi:hypothetical protein C7N83_05910 [Neisseria iguanae]|uniref:Uncharacterized protein n=1 Tax=Neisseria iguanae TaxID=90242 RepID=A0A2P7U0G6_9NEIS|nr:hypothetical protein C7N83_05910 [Neisseria iguanae]
MSGQGTLGIADFCGVAAFSDSQRCRSGNVYRAALVPKNHLSRPLPPHAVVQQFTHLPPSHTQTADQVRRQITEIAGLHDFGDAGEAALLEP